MDEDARTQATDSRRRGREHAGENCAIPEHVGARRGEEDAPTTTTSSSGTSSTAVASSSSGNDVVTTTSSSGEESGTRRVDSKRKAERGHEKDPEREDGQCMRTEGIKRKTVEEEEESMLRKTVKFLKTLQRSEAKKESEGVVELVEVTQFEE